MYKPSFVDAYKKSRSKLPIHVWHQVAGRHLPQFQTDEDVYTPVPIYVKLSGGINDPNGSVRLSVCPTNKDWYRDLTSALTEMTGKKNIDVANMEGKCISGFDTKHLFAAGECDVMCNGKLLRLESVVEPPLRMATDKSKTLKQWWEEQSETISRDVAQVLRNKNMSEIAGATTKNGEVYKVIQSKLQENAPKDFLKVYGSGLIRTSVDDLSDKLLHAVRRGLVANEQQIRHYHASTSNPDQSLWKQKETQNIQSSYTDDFTLYRDIIDDAIYHPAVCRDVIHSVLYGTKKMEGPVTPSVKKQEFSDYHPLESFYKSYYYNTYGKLPGHVVSAYNKTIGTNMQQKMFPGKAEEAFNVFHMLSGRAFIGNVLDTLLVTKRGRRRWDAKQRWKQAEKKGAPQKEINFYKKQYEKEDAKIRGKKGRKNKKAKDNINLVHISDLLMDDEYVSIDSKMELPRLVPIDSKMELPRLVPIDQEMENEELVGPNIFSRKYWRNRKTRKEGEKELDQLDREEEQLRQRRVEAQRKANVESQITSELPRLVPIDQEISSKPRLVPIGSKTDLPRLVPIDQGINSKLPRLVPIDSNVKSRLVPIPRDEILNSNLWDDTDELPSISQLLSGNY